MLPSYIEVRQSVEGAIEQLEQVRGPLRKKRSRYNWALLAAICLTFLLFYLNSGFFLLFLVLIIVIIVLLVINWFKGGKQYRSLFKQIVVGPMMQSMVDLCSLPNETEQYEYSCSYHPEDRIDDQWIKRSRLYDIHIDETHGEDLFKGKLGLTDFMFSEIRLVQEQHSTDSKGNSSTTRVDMFKGVLFIADFHKDFNGITILSGNIGNGGFFSRMLSRLASTSYKAPIKLELENELFNKMFQARTTDEIQARYLLTSSMMERLMDFRKRRKEPLSISFVDSFMSISMWSRKNYFEAKLSKPVTGEYLEAIYEDLKFFFGWIEEFDLNTRIWSKE